MDTIGGKKLGDWVHRPTKTILKSNEEKLFFVNKVTNELIAEIEKLTKERDQYKNLLEKQKENLFPQKEIDIEIKRKALELQLKGLSYRKIAEILDISKSSVGNIINEYNKPMDT